MDDGESPWTPLREIAGGGSMPSARRSPLVTPTLDCDRTGFWAWAEANGYPLVMTAVASQGGKRSDTQGHQRPPPRSRIQGSGDSVLEEGSAWDFCLATEILTAWI